MKDTTFAFVVTVLLGIIIFGLSGPGKSDVKSTARLLGMAATPLGKL